jgi:pyruvate,water dikinase
MVDLEQSGGTVSPQIAELSRQGPEAFARTKIPSAVEQAVRKAIEGLARGRLWAVRSSAMMEDQPQTSFAGQYESFLNVPGDEVLDKVRRCWMSLFNARAVAYRVRNQIPHESVAMAVIVQQMVPAEVAGVLFTADPVSGDANCIVLEAARGLGDQVVSGHVTPERVVLSKARLEVIQRTAGRVQARETRSAQQLQRHQAGACSMTEGMILEDKLARRLAEMSLRVQKILGGPLDIEWAVCDGEIHLLQARTMTGCPQAKTWEARQVWTNLNAGEVLPDVTTPITWSLLQHFLDPLFRSVFRLHGAVVRSSSFAGLVAGRVYVNANIGLAGIKPFWFLFERIPNAARALGGGQIEASRRLLESIPDEDLPDLGFRWHRYLLSLPRILLDLLKHSPRRGDAWTARLKVQTDELFRVEIEPMSTPELIRFFSRLIRDSLGHWDLLYLGTQAAALLVLQVACRNWLNDLAIGYRLFSGLGGVAEAEAGLALWRLALLAHGDQQIESALASGASWADTLVTLRQTEHGREFIGQWNAFMATHGHRARGELELFNPRWSETPDYISGLVCGYLRSVDKLNPLENQRRLADERRQLTEQCRRRLRNPLKRWLFSRSLGRAQKLAINREEWKNQAVRHIAILRRVLLELGQRFQQQGVLSDRDDIFFLQIPEIESMGVGKLCLDLRDRIHSRREEYALNLKLEPPPVVVGRFTANTPAVPQPDGDVKVLEGIPVSPGTVTGRAKVVLRSDNHEQVFPGEILIAPFTDPAWTPYFVSAAGVVMDHGGILSHGSIVAREYGLPAVTNLGSATLLIRTGDLIQVDGNRGWVTILERV